jgi:hypothetical protein
MSALVTRLDAVATKVAGGSIRAGRDWGGAGVVISATHAPAPEPESFYPDPRWVETPHAAQLSWLFVQLRDAFSPHPAYNGSTKFEVFGRLANAALRWNDRSHDLSNMKDLLAAVLHEAYAIAEEMDDGTFEYLPVTSGNAIVDDYIDDPERSGFHGVEETKAYFASKGFEL